jgi:hypothetical protein
VNVVLAGTIVSTVLMLHAIINGLLLRRPEPAGIVSERVAILVPCRNEEANIADLVASLRAQRHLPQVAIRFLDDASMDRTHALLMEHACDDDRIAILAGQPLEAGWLGKPFACHQLAAASTAADVLVFIDADVRLTPDAVAQAIATMRAHGLALVSPYPRQISRTWAERVVQPLLQWSWLATLPLRWAERSARTSLAAANGQFLVMDAAAYRETQGHAAIRDEVLDDIRMLQLFKKHGHRGVVIDGSTIATCRMYTSWPELRAGYTKWLWSAFGSIPSSLAIGGVLTLAYLVPPIAAMTGSAIGVIGYLTAVIGRMVSAVRSGDRLRDALLHPLSIALLLVLVGLSWLGRRRGALTWKERTLA